MSYTQVLIPNTNPAHDCGVKFTDGSFGVISVTDGPSPFEPEKLLVTARGRRVKADGRNVKTVELKTVQCVPVVKAFERGEYNDQAMQEIIGECAAALEAVAVPVAVPVAETPATPVPAPVPVLAPETPTAS